MAEGPGVTEALWPKSLARFQAEQRICGVGEVVGRTRGPQADLVLRAQPDSLGALGSAPIPGSSPLGLKEGQGLLEPEGAPSFGSALWLPGAGLGQPLGPACRDLRQLPAGPLQSGWLWTHTLASLGPAAPGAARRPGFGGS